MRSTHHIYKGASFVLGFPGGSVVKKLPTQETQVLSLDQEDPLKEEMAIHSIFFPEKCHGQRSLAGYSPSTGKTIRQYLVTKQQSFMLHYIHPHFLFIFFFSPLGAKPNHFQCSSLHLASLCLACF